MLSLGPRKQVYIFLSLKIYYCVPIYSFIGNAKVEKLDKDNDDKNNDTIDNDSPPVIYIAKYNRLIDTANLTALDVNKNEDSIDAVPSNSTEKER